MTAIATQAPTELSMDPSAPATNSMTPEEATVPASPKPQDIEETSSTGANPKSMKRGVSFDKIEIREYSRCMGNNPATTHGPSLSLDWHYDHAGTYDLEEYEQSRPDRRAHQQMLIPGCVREEILLAHTDVTRKQMSKSVAEIKAARHSRQMCVAMQEFEDWAWLGETILRRLRRLRSGISKKKEQQLLWDNAKHVMESKAALKALKECSSDDGSTEGTDDTRPCGSSDFNEEAAVSNE